MSLAETKPEANGVDRSTAGAKILQFREALRSRTGAVGGWAQQRATAAKTTAERHPMATAGIAAGAALIGGIALGMLLSGQMAGLKRTLQPQGSFGSRARAMLKR